MATLSAAGIGSGLDVNSLLEQIVAAERGPKENQLNLKEVKIQAELSAFGSLKGALSSFQSSLTQLKNQTSFSSNKINIANKDMLTATATSIAKEGSYSVKVDQLAQSHSLASIAFEDTSSVIGSGTLTFDFGTVSYDPDSDAITSAFVSNPDRSSESIVIDNTNNTVEGVRDAINEAGIGVSASIVNDGNGYRLLITSDQMGDANALEISVTDDSDTNNTDLAGLSQLVFKEGATNLDQTQAGQDAIVSVNGLQINRESNTVTEAIHGVTLNLLSVDTVATQLTITQNTSGAEKNINGFVSAFNDLVNLFDSLTAYNAETGEKGTLIGDSTTRNIMNQIRRELTNSINTGGSYSSLSGIGITTQRDGTLAVDATKLKSAIEADFESVAELFYANANPSDADITYISSTASVKEGKYAVSIDTLATKGTFTPLSSTTADIVIGASNNTFSLTVDGISTGTVTLSQATYSDMDALAQEIQNRINGSSLEGKGAGVTVSYVTDPGDATKGYFEIVSSTYGSDSSVSVVAQNSTLGFTSSATSTTGVDVSGYIGDTPATGKGQYLTGEGSAAGLELKIEGLTTGGRGSVEYSLGFAAKMDSILDSFLSSTGQLTAKSDSLTAQIEDISGQRVELNKRVAAIQERYQKQFTALDVLIGQLNTTSSYLQQQLDSLPKIEVYRRK